MIIRRLYLKETIIFLFLLLSGIFSLFSITFISQQIKNQEIIIKKNIKEYNEFDISHVCKITDCNEIEIVEKNISSYFRLGKNDILENFEQRPQRFSVSSFAFSTDNGIEGIIKIDDVIFYLPISTGVKFSVFLALLFAFFFIICSYIFFYYVKNRIEEKIMIANQKKEILDNHLAKLVSSNIFHEIATPLSSIAYELSVIEEEVEPKTISKTVIESIEKIKTNLGLIENIAYKTRADKIRKKINVTDKTVYEIIEECFSSVMFINKTFTHHIDFQLKKFRLDDGKLSKEDFQNIIINHAKNSFEASAKTLMFKFVMSEEKYLLMELEDDGKGIPKDILNHVYELDFSTKGEKSGSRGIGLYLCREVLRSVGGDERIVNSSESGTAIEIKIPII